MAQKPEYTRDDVVSVADAVMKNPGVPVDSSNFPSGMEEEVVNEINARQQHHDDIQAALKKQTPQERSIRNSAPSAVDDIGKDTDPDHSAPMAGLLGASDSLTLGHTDELAGLIGAIDGHGYEPVRNAIREKQDFARKNHPYAYHGMGLLGATQLPQKLPAAGAGAIAGEGYSNKKLSDPGMGNDIDTGGLLGAAAEPLLAGAGKLAGRAVSALSKSMAGDFWDPVLLRALFPGKGGSDKITEMLANDAVPASEVTGPSAKEVTDVVRANSKFPYLSPQGAKDAIQVPAIAQGSRGTIANPIENIPQSEPFDSIPGQMHSTPAPQRGPGWTPQAGPPKEIDLGGDPRGWVQANKSATTPAQELYQNASTEDLNGILPSGPAARVPGRAVPVKARPPEPPQDVNLEVHRPYSPAEFPPLSPAERVATQGLSNMSDAPSNGMDPSTVGGGLSRMIQKNVVGPTAIGIPKAGQAMQRMLDLLHNNPAEYGSQADLLKGIVNHVMSSQDPSFSDYLAKETFPAYLALSLQADKKGDNGGR